jgi:hypothetical protein
MSEKREMIEIEVEIDIESGDVYLSRDHEAALEVAKALNPDDIGEMQCFIDDKPKTIDGEKNYKSFCG